ncbi:hypothetical protein TCON_2626 [Astathelohania contejeani]|uniref:tRNA (adenine(58)-N(1))-methyltransferase non-catalytic subunit TRM6 n=1 Tax=Astathelohania contejeani TaxID=164912 RepID=A0ABQ7HVH2_9MICR|nr:hypothetical protein TCON_2626 [Thelohania contejeani]
MVILEGDFVIIKTKSGQSTITQISHTEEFIASKYKLKIPLISLIGLQYNTWYTISNNLSITKEEQAIEETDGWENKNIHTQRKYKLKKINKSLKSIYIEALSPYTLLTHYRLKWPRKLCWLGLSELAFISGMLESGRTILLLDDVKNVFLYTILYKMCGDVDLTVIKKRHDNNRTGYLKGKYAQIVIGDTVDRFFDLGFFLGGCGLEHIKLYDKCVDKIVVYCWLREHANEIYKYLILNDKFKEVQMVSFMNREYQIEENIHPIVRGDLGSGYIITGLRIK